MSYGTSLVAAICPRTTLGWVPRQERPLSFLLQQTERGGGVHAHADGMRAP